MTSASPADLLITGCTVLQHDEQERIGFREDAAVVIRDGLVDSVVDAAGTAGLPAAERIDARGQVALPGLVDCHTHAPMVALRGLAARLPQVRLAHHHPGPRPAGGGRPRRTGHRRRRLQQHPLRVGGDGPHRSRPEGGDP